MANTQYDVLWNRAPETYVILLTTISPPPKFNRKEIEHLEKEKKSTLFPLHKIDVKQNKTKSTPTALRMTALSSKSASALTQALPTCRPPWAPSSENEPHLPRVRRSNGNKINPRIP